MSAPASDLPADGPLFLSGAGSEGVNGRYERDGDYKSRPMWTSQGTGIQIWWNHGQWRIGNTNDYW